MGAVAGAGGVTLSPSAELGQAEIKSAAAVLLHLLLWRGGFGNDLAVRPLRDAKLDAAIEVPTVSRPCVHQPALQAFRALAGQSAVWDRAREVWRERHQGNPA